MTLFPVILRALAPLFLLIVLGYLLKRARVLHVTHVPILNSIVVNVTLPALIVKGLATAPTLPRGALDLPLALLGAQAVIMLLAWIAGKAVNLPKAVCGALMIVSVFGNTGFLGYPMTLALYPRQFPEAILLDQFGMTIALYLCAPIIGIHWGLAGGPSKGVGATVLRFARSPLFLSVVAGAIIRAIPWPHAFLDKHLVNNVGSIVAQCLTYLGQGTTPLILMSLGIALRPGSARTFAAPLLLASGLKLLVCPVIMWIICRGLHMQSSLLAEGILSSSMPTAVMAAVLSAEHNLEGDFAVSVAFGSTVLSAFTVPLMISLLH